MVSITCMGTGWAVARLIVKMAREVSKHRANKKGPEWLPGLAHFFQSDQYFAISASYCALKRL